VKYQLEIKEAALAKLRELPEDIRRAIGYRMHLLQTDLAGDVKKLTAQEKKYRLRVGNFRVLFRLEGDTIMVYDVRDRKEAYE
jgi:mRNA interferase RelE/StbE